jgi:hypothetical protein
MKNSIKLLGTLILNGSDVVVNLLNKNNKRITKNNIITATMPGIKLKISLARISFSFHQFVEHNP